MLRMVALTIFVCTIMFGSFASADQGTVVKYSQLPGYLIDPNEMLISGEDIPSDVDWGALVANTGPVPPPPNWIIADDFRDPFDTQVLTVRWWGSYVGETFGPDPNGGAIVPLFGPGSEDGYVFSFFTDQPADPLITPFSRPDFLLATYFAPFPAVTIMPTGHKGWDGHDIFQYEVNLQDTHLEHAQPGIADEIGFNQVPGETYWLAINAEVGHTIEVVTLPDGTTDWIEVDTGKFAQPGVDPLNPDGHFWGWHTSPEFFNDVATMGHLLMGPGGEWIYPREDWQPIQPNHFLTDMAFELLTVPEPATCMLMMIGLACTVGCRFAGKS